MSVAYRSFLAALSLGTAAVGSAHAQMSNTGIRLSAAGVTRGFGSGPSGFFEGTQFFPPVTGSGMLGGSGSSEFPPTSLVAITNYAVTSLGERGIRASATGRASATVDTVASVSAVSSSSVGFIFTLNHPQLCDFWGQIEQSTAGLNPALSTATAKLSLRRTDIIAPPLVFAELLNLENGVRMQTLNEVLPAGQYQLDVEFRSVVIAEESPDSGLITASYAVSLVVPSPTGGVILGMGALALGPRRRRR